MTTKKENFIDRLVELANDSGLDMRQLGEIFDIAGFNALLGLDIPKRCKISVLTNCHKEKLRQLRRLSK